MQGLPGSCVQIFPHRSRLPISSLIQAGSGSGGYLDCIIRQGRDCRIRVAVVLVFSFFFLLLFYSLVRHYNKRNTQQCIMARQKVPGGEVSLLPGFTLSYSASFLFSAA